MRSQNEPKSIGKVEIVSEGNWLGKSRRTYFLSNKCHDLLHEVSLQQGLNHSAVIELAVRVYYQQVIGPVPPIPLITRRFGERSGDNF